MQDWTRNILSVKIKIMSFNPKARRLFGQLNTQAGVDSAHFGKRSLTPPNFILEQQTVSHLTSSTKILCSIEVAEIEIRTLGGLHSDQGPGEKYFDKKF